MIHLSTERLIIRDPLPTDLNDLHRILSDTDTMYYLQDIMTNALEDSKQNLDDAIAESQSHNREKYFFTIVAKESDAYVGSVGYTVTEVTPVGKLVHAGYFLSPEHHGKGYMTEALNEVIRFAFEDNDVFRISTGCLSENHASERVMQKCGFIKEADFKSHTWHDGVMKDRVEYRLLRDEWSTRPK